MHLRDSFSHFAPLSDSIDLDSTHGFQFELLAIRARELLSGRTDQQVTDALDTLDWILAEGHMQLEQAALDALSEDSDRESFVLTDTKALKLYMPHFDIQGQSHFPHATWPEYFAILALAQIGSALNENDDEQLKALVASVGIEPESVTDQLKTLRLDCLLEATEAVATAEAFQQTQSDNQTSGRSGGRAKAAKYEELKQLVLNEWKKHHQHRSNRQAAIKIWPCVPDHLKALLRTDAPEQRLESWIGAFKRAKSND